MAFPWFVLLFGWASALLFVALAGYKIYRIASLPTNLRWEVYPVPHEAKDKRSYGGSYMEEVGWAKRPRPSSLWSDWVEMGSEIFFLKRVRKHNPYGLWPFSLTLHWGLYFLVLWLALLLAAVFTPALAFLIHPIGIAAFILGLIGSLGIVIKRATHPSLRLYTAPIDYFNLSFLFAIFGLGLISWLVDPRLSQPQAYLKSLVLLHPILLSPTVLVFFLLLQAFAVYMPLSKLIHYMMKHFTYHETLWDDAPNVKGSSRARRLERQLSYPLTWAGPHIEPGKTWLEEVSITGRIEGQGK